MSGNRTIALTDAGVVCERSARGTETQWFYTAF